ncbi:MAG: hypothetical protein ACXACY_29925 [Candidatus Hodarchaeales archaeon]
MFKRFTLLFVLFFISITVGCLGGIDEIDDGWRDDGIVLMQHELEGYFTCFGCSTPSEVPAMCIDPIQEMKQVTETEERYCNENFELVENG